MKKFLPLLLIISIVFGLDCKDLMKFKDICIFKKINIQSLKSHCHGKKENHSKSGGCDCPEKKSISLQESFKLKKDFTRLELVFHSPINIFYSSEITPNMHLSHLHKKSILHPQISPTKTIHLLV